jgi:GNAT superfamily N-acetyltransferase
MSVTVTPLTGEAMAAALPALARLRIAVFRDWPYLYDGTLEYEQDYLEKFSKSPDTVIVAAADGEAIVGIATGSPMLGHADAFAEPFRERGYDIGRIFYFGESVLLKSHRGRGIGQAFFDHREAHARASGGYTHAAFCGVVRPEEHPMRPADYVPLDGFWEKRGYRQMEGLVGRFSWRDIGQAEQTAKAMQFWMKAL